MTPVVRIAATLAFIFVIAFIENVAELALLGHFLTEWEWSAPYLEGMAVMIFMRRIWA